MQTVTLDELATAGAIVVITDPVAAALSGTNLVEVRRQADGSSILMSRRNVGAVRFADLQVQVKPKDGVGISRLLFLLGYATDPGWRDEEVSAEVEEDLWPALAESLVRQAERALLNGVLQGYRTQHDALQTVRGRIRISDQVSRRPGLMVPLEVTYDEYTHDIVENRILRTAIRHMLAVPRLSNKAKARLAHLDARLTGVSVLHHRAHLPPWQRTRLNARYHSALRLSEVILRNTSAEVSHEGLAMAAFVVPMWKVYEDFIATALTESLARFPGQTCGQYKAFLDEPAETRTDGGKQNQVPMFIDLVHLVDGLPTLIFDAKYKVSRSDGRYPNADHYQMLAYCTALAVPQAWLVYASGTGGTVSRKIRNSGVTVVEYPLNLGRSPDELLFEIDALADSAWAATVSIGRLSELTPAWFSLAEHFDSEAELALLHGLFNRGAPLPTSDYSHLNGASFDLAWPSFRIGVGATVVTELDGWTIVLPELEMIIQALAGAGALSGGK